VDSIEQSSPQCQDKRPNLALLMDLIDALEPELEVHQGPTALWAAELRRELAETLEVLDGG